MNELLLRVVAWGKEWGLSLAPYETLTYRGVPAYLGPYSHAIWLDGTIGYQTVGNHNSAILDLVREVAGNRNPWEKELDGVLAMALIHEIAHALDPDLPPNSNEDDFVAFEFAAARLLGIGRRHVNHWFTGFVSARLSGAWPEYLQEDRDRIRKRSRARYIELGMMSREGKLIVSMPSMSWIQKRTLEPVELEG